MVELLVYAVGAKVQCQSTSSAPARGRLPFARQGCNFQSLVTDSSTGLLLPGFPLLTLRYNSRRGGPVEEAQPVPHMSRLQLRRV